MNLFDYLIQLGFWQWIGTIMLFVGTAGALSAFRLFHYVNKETKAADAARKEGKE